MAEIERITDDERAGLETVEPLSTDWRVQKALRIIDRFTTPPDFGVEHKLLTDWINSLPEPFRGFVHALETNADPSGNIRAAVCQRENAEALAARVKELETQLETRDARIAEALRTLSTPSTWSEFASQARKALIDG